MGPTKVVRGGTPLTCAHCSGQTFWERSALLNTPGMTWLGLDWLNESAEVFVCGTCGRLEWFLFVPDPDNPEPVAITCLSCGKLIPPATDTCLACGWTYALGEDAEVRD